MEFWERLEKLMESSEVVIDRPKGSKHPKFPEFVYPIAYGYLSGTTGGDGAEVDIWVGSENPKTLFAIACTVDSKKNDAEVKLLLGCNEEEIETVNQFYASNRFMSGLIVRRDNNA